MLLDVPEHTVEHASACIRGGARRTDLGLEQTVAPPKRGDSPGNTTVTTDSQAVVTTSD